MAFKMNSSMGKKVTPLRQDNKYLGAEKQAEDIMKKSKSLRKFNERDLAIEKAAATDSIMASRPKNAHLYTKKEKERMGHKAANETRKVNKASTTVERGSKMDPKTGPKDTYKRKPASPAKQTKPTAKKMDRDMAKGPSRDSMQASKNPKSENNAIGGRTLEKNGIRGTKVDGWNKMDGSSPKSGRKWGSPAKKAPAKMKKC